MLAWNLGLSTKSRFGSQSFIHRLNRGRENFVISYLRMHAINFALSVSDALSELEALAVVNSVQAETFDFLEAVW